MVDREPSQSQQKTLNAHWEQFLREELGKTIFVEDYRIRTDEETGETKALTFFKLTPPGETDLSKEKI